MDKNSNINNIFASGKNSANNQNHQIRLRHQLINDHFQNYKVYNIPKAQLIIADVPYNIGKNAYGSNPS